MNQKKVLIDPFISGNTLAGSIALTELKPDYILLSHGHQDHVLDVETIYRQCEPLIIANFEVATWFQKRGLDRTLGMNQGGKRQFDFGSVKLVNAIHSSSLPDGSYGGNPVGFLIESEGRCLYYAGDTSLHQDMKLIGEFHQVDAAFLPIGDTFTMGIEDALIAADFAGTKKVFGMHYNTFPPIEIDLVKAKNLADSQGKELILMQIGNSTNL